MPEETTVAEHPEEEIVQAGIEEDQPEKETDPIAEVVADEDAETPPAEEEEPSEVETPPVQEAKKDEPDESTKVQELESHIRELNKSLHVLRRQIKEKPKDEAEPLSPEQLRQLFKEHADDPDTLFNIVNYMTEQQGKKAGKEAIDATTIASQKSKHDEIISVNYPDLLQEDSPLRREADVIKNEFRIDSHPLGDMLAMGIFIQNKLPQIRAEAYKAGKAEALKAKGEDARKKNVKESSLTPKGGNKGKGKAMLEGQFLETAKQMGLTEAQQKIYARFIANKEGE